jgi:hypothetical protein
VKSHPKIFLHFGLGLKLLWPGQSIEQQASSLFFDYYKNGIFLLSLLALVFVTRKGFTGSARQLDMLLVQ